MGIATSSIRFRTLRYTEVFESGSGADRPGLDVAAPARTPLPTRPGGSTLSAGALARQRRLEGIVAQAAGAPGGTDGVRRLRPPKIFPSEVVARLPLPGMWHAVAYRNDSDARRRAREKVAAQIAGSSARPRIVIAHSLGSMVVLDALHIYDFGIDVLVTVGSPLGIDDGRTYEWDPVVEFPSERVGGWLNVVNTRDPVPWGRGASRRFPQAVDAFITAGSRLSGPGGFHDPGVYTGSTVVAATVADSLSL